MLIDATGWTLIHFLWQGALVALIFALADASSRRASAPFRYGLASVAMLTMLVCGASTFFWILSFPEEGGRTVLLRLSDTSSTLIHSSGLTPSEPSREGNYLPWLVYFWIAGVAAMSLRLSTQWIMLQRCRRQGIRILDGVWQERIQRIAGRLELRRAVRLYESAVADVPAVIGWIRPIILLPASALTQLSPAQIEALLAHELAHVRRHDYAINLLQSFVETIFFYHPGVWWVSRRMREERENCCDDLAVMACGDPIIYARALAGMEQLRSSLPGLAMAANGGGLLHRIQRLVAPQKMPRRMAPLSVAALTALAAAVLVWAAPQQSKSQAAPQLPATESQAPTVLIAQRPVRPAQSQTPKPASPTPAPAPARTGEGYIDELQRAGYTNLSVDQMISMKIHGVTPAYINEVKSVGWTVTPDQLVAFRIHGVNAETVKELRALGYSLTPDQAISAQVHKVTSAFANGWKQEGMTGMDFDDLVALKIHGADPAQVRELRTLGFTALSADDVVHLRVMGVTADFIREVQAKGFRDLKLEQIIQLKQLGIFGSKDSK